MDRFDIQGGHRLAGEVAVNGAKNAALPLMAAALMGTGTSRLTGIPDLRDIRTMSALLGQLGVQVDRTADGTIEITPEDDGKVTAPYELVRQMRASVCLLGPLLARRGRARVSQPGGCVIGVRPIDLHLKGLGGLGAEIELDGGYIHASAPELTGTEIYLGGAQGSTALGTCNVMMAACLARGRTVIECAACEPEIVDLAEFLAQMGARIEGAGSHRIVIDGVPSLHGAEHRVIPDRIEAGTFMTAAALTRGDVTIRGVRVDHLSAVIDTLRRIGVTVDTDGDECRVRAVNHFRAAEVVALPYPGLPTDLQAQITALLATADGISVVTDKVFPDRFMHVAELNRMGAQIRKAGSSAIIVGQPRLTPAPVMASDLRASAALVLAAMAADGYTIVHRVYHIDRGYDRIEQRLNKLGAQIERVQEDYP
ncbi:MAG: UDP-N-acetylglucosamine 1-carboxyvinyltransferase [Planctomycetota bacterium]